MKNIFSLMGVFMLCAASIFAQDSSKTSAYLKSTTKSTTKSTIKSTIKSHSSSHAPIGVMGDHLHSKGEWMLSYRFMSMSMNGNLLKSEDVSDMELYQSYMVAPQSMNMNMHMLGLMYAPSNWLTFMVMGQYVHNEMQLKMMSGMDFTTQSSGISDTKVSVLIKAFSTSHHRMHGTIGVSIPSGSIDVRDDLPMMKNVRLAYPMQIGTGTWDPIIGLTYAGHSKMLTWGQQTSFTSRFSDNANGYNFGQRVEATAWFGVSANRALSFSGRAKFAFVSKIDGADSTLNSMMMPLFNSLNSGSRIVEGLLGVNYLFTKGVLRNLRIAIEFALPVLQNMHGIQMKREWSGTVGIQYAFN